jgi:hypothetical protein
MRYESGPGGGAGLCPAGAKSLAAEGGAERRGFTGEPWVHPCSEPVAERLSSLLPEPIRRLAHGEDCSSRLILNS